MTEISHEIGREVGVLVDRRGAVTHAMVGSTSAIEMPEWGRLRAGQGRLRGLRCIHTFLGDEPLTHDDLTDLAKLRLDAMVTLGMDASGVPTEAHVAHLRPANLDGTVARLKREGVKFLEEIHPWGNSRAAMIEGPDRIAIELVEVK